MNAVRSTLTANEPKIHPSVIEILVAKMEGKGKQPILLRT